MVRPEPLPGLSLSARSLGRDGRGLLPNICTSASAANWVLPPRKRATPRRCWPKDIAAAAIRSATRPARTLPTSSSYLPCSMPRKTASRFLEEDQLDPEQPTSAIVVHHRRRNISRSDVARRQRNFLLCATQFIPVAGLTRGPTSSHRRDKTWMRGSGPRKGRG
jgi:hypothetical protein